MPMIFSDASSNRWIIRPARPRATASGLSTTSVRSRNDSATVVLSLSQGGHRVAALVNTLATQAGVRDAGVRILHGDEQVDVLSFTHKGRSGERGRPVRHRSSDHAFVSSRDRPDPLVRRTEGGPRG